MRIVIAGDSAGKPLIDVIEAHLAQQPGVVVINLSPGAANSPATVGEPYANTAERAAAGIIEGQYDRGILCCGTGIGVAICANKVPGIRAAQTHDTYSAERAAKSNNAQIITMGARVIGPELAKSIVDAFLGSDFDPAGSSAGNVAAIAALDAKYSAD
jgi:D-erythrulose 4-phosphate isomerase